MEELSNRGRHVYYDEFACPSVKVEDEDIKYLCKDFSERAERKITRKDLENLNLIIGNEKDTATNAYAILLGKHDYTSRIQCARFRGTERVDFLDKKEYEGPLCEQIDEAYKFVLNYLSMAVEIDGIVHKEKYELPHKAIRELIINAVIHRNYQISSSVQVAVYDDRVEISSPGTIYGSLTLEEAMEGRSSIRNKTLARTLEKIDILEGWGSGLKRIFSQCEEYGIPYPVFVEIGDMLRVNFYRPSYKNIGDKSAIKQDIGDKSAINYKEIILEYLEEHAEARTQEISLYIGLKLSRTKDYLSELVEEGKIIANGANKNRTYSLKK